jgi:hypothetical protein
LGESEWEEDREDEEREGSCSSTPKPKQFLLMPFPFGLLVTLHHFINKTVKNNCLGLQRNNTYLSPE